MSFQATTELCIYEDDKAINFNPLTLTRPIFELRCGMFNLHQKLVHHFPGHRVRYFVRHELVDLMREKRGKELINTRPEQDSFFINGRFVLHEDLPDSLPASTALVAGDQVVGAFLQQKEIDKLEFSSGGFLRSRAFEHLPRRKIKGVLLDYLWHLVHRNGDEIERDFRYIQRGDQILGKVHERAVLMGRENIHIGLGATIQPGVVINAETGPVFIADGATIMANAVIEGPVYIGQNSRVKIGAKIYENTSIGPVCKVGGEIEASIIHGYSNKQHEGFLGHAYLGEWVNLGADTNNSDLKNNYGPVKVYVNGKMVDTGSTFVGLFMGDHSKCGINTMFNTGTVVGVMCNVFGSGYSPKHIANFTWGGIELNKLHAFDKAVETARIVMGRRQQELTPAAEKLLRRIFDQRQGEK